MTSGPAANSYPCETHPSVSLILKCPPQDLILKTCSLTAGALWATVEPFGGGALLRKVSHYDVPLEVTIPLPILVALVPVPWSPAVPLLPALLL